MLPFKLIYHPFPVELSDIHGALTVDTKGIHMIVINCTIDEETQIHALKHELSHLKFNHLYDATKGIEEVEAEADRHADSMTDDEFAELMQYQIKAG